MSADARFPVFYGKGQFFFSLFAIFLEWRKTSEQVKHFCVAVWH